MKLINIKSFYGTFFSYDRIIKKKWDQRDLTESHMLNLIGSSQVTFSRINVTGQHMNF